MMTDFAQLYAETFTAAEMKEIADFYRGGTGAKFIQSTPIFMQKGAQIGIKYSERMVKEMGGAGAAPVAQEMTKPDFDLFVIGGGSGGVRAARIAAGYGARVGIAEEYRFGGTCVIRGCVPKKLLVYASRFSDEFEDAADFGWTVPAAHIRLGQAHRREGQRDCAARRYLSFGFVES